MASITSKREMKQLMIGASDGSKELVADAKKRGVYTIVVGQNDKGRTLESIEADEQWVMDTTDIDNLEKKCREEKVDAIINGISTFNIEVCMELAKRLNLPCYATPESWHYTMNKYDFKKLCREVGVPVAKDFFVSDVPTKEELEKIQYPVVVKAVDLSSNRGMSYCYEPSDIQPACEYARSLSTSTNVVIEKMLEGTEYTAHYAMADGKASLVNFCCMFSQTGYPGNCYSITTSETDELENFLAEVHPNLKKFIYKAGIKEGVCWFEMMLDKDGHLYVLEMGYRMSGDLYAIPIREVCGFDSYKWLNDISLGIKHTFEDLPEEMHRVPERIGTSYILWSNEKQGKITKLEGLDEIRKLPGVYVDNVLRIGSHINPHQYLVIILIESKDIKELIETIRSINDTVEIEVENYGSAYIKFTDFDKIEEKAKKLR